MADDLKPQSWWQTLPGILTSLTATITAIAGLVALLINQCGHPSTPPNPTHVTTEDPNGWALWCRGSVGMASTNGTNLIVVFSKGAHPATEGLEPSQCSFPDRGLRANEPNRIVDERPSEGEAQHMAELINAGASWTFWVTNPMDTIREFRAHKSEKQG
jgi:hypothetical protein